MRNKIIVVIALAATLGSGGLVYARKTADSDIKIDALGAVFGVKTCADLGACDDGRFTRFGECVREPVKPENGS